MFLAFSVSLFIIKEVSLHDVLKKSQNCTVCDFSIPPVGRRDYLRGQEERSGDSTVPASRPRLVLRSDSGGRSVVSRHRGDASHGCLSVVWFLPSLLPTTEPRHNCTLAIRIVLRIK